MNTNQNMNPEKYEAYMKATHRLGRAVSLLTLVMLLGAPFLIGGLLGTMPDLVYTPMLGAGGSYLAFITGNLINMKIPCAMNARELVNAKAGTAENEVISTLSIATSALVTIVVLALGVALMIPLRPVLESPALQPAFANVVPALFGAMAYKYFRKDVRLAVIPLVCMSLLFMFVPSLTSSTSFMIIPAGAMAIGLSWLRYRKARKEEQK